MTQAVALSVHKPLAEQAFLATAAARKVRDEVMARLAPFAATAQGRERLRALPFLASAEEAEKAALAVMADKEIAIRLDRDRVKALLGKLAAAAEPPTRQQAGRLVACETEEIREAWEKRGLHRFARLAGPEGLRQADGYDLVLFLYEDGAPVEVESLVEIPATASLAEVAPESVLAWFQANRAALAAMSELAAILGKPSQAPAALALLEEAQRAHTTPLALRRHVEDVRLEVDRLVRERTASVVVSGADVLESLGRRLPPALQLAVDAALAEGARILQERTGLSLQPYLAGSPVQVDEDELERIEGQLAARGHVDAFVRLARAAKALAALRSGLEGEMSVWRDFEVRFALGCFALHNDLHPARFTSRLRFDASVHLDLAGAEHEGKAQRIGYRLGEDAPVALLTGANSGGKTTLLEHLIQLMLMARMGLPVVGAGVELPWVEEVHYVTARRSLDAGAFESFLKAFLPVALGDRRRLVLADEVESVTEAEAAARILGCFLDRLHGSGSLAVVVSHMAPQILAHTTAPVRVDGIEATGLDARNRLVVDRNPRLGRFARSTPELIVQRLAATAKGPARELFADLLARFQGVQAPVRRRPAREGHK
ncbi:MAG: hypothetical protein ABR562_02130 [Thermoplasmatota archaeon]|nr:hypothetical protein [Halobacteriales archaeon]